MVLKIGNIILYIILNSESILKNTPYYKLENGNVLWGASPQILSWFTRFTCPFPIASLLEKTVNNPNFTPDIFQHRNRVL